jgi:hypothetical protein
VNLTLSSIHTRVGETYTFALAIADEKYVATMTYRKSAAEVTTATWVFALTSIARV